MPLEIQRLFESYNAPYRNGSAACGRCQRCVQLLACPSWRSHAPQPNIGHWRWSRAISYQLSALAQNFFAFCEEVMDKDSICR
jgi:hypothetical protein